MKRWHGTYERLDRLSRERALTDAESSLLEFAIHQIDGYAEPASDGSRWSPEDERKFVNAVSDGVPIRAAARALGRSSSAGVGKWHRLQRQLSPIPAVAAELERRGVVLPGTALRLRG